MYVQTPEGVWAAKVMFGSWDTQASFVCYYIDGLSDGVGTVFSRPYCAWGLRDGYKMTDGNQISFFEQGMFRQGGLSVASCNGEPCLFN